MKNMQHPKTGPQSGWAMLVVVMVVVTTSAALALMLTSSAASDRTANTTRRASDARFRAEGGLAVAKRQLLLAVANFRDPSPSGTVDVGGIPVNWQVQAAGFELETTDATGIQSTRTRYQLRSTAEVFGSQETVLRMVDAVAIPIFQFAVFYTEDLEINPGPDMTIRGRVHTNGDLFLNSGGTLTLDSNYVHAVGDIYRHRKDDPNRADGTVTVRQWVGNTFDPANLAAYFTLNSAAQMDALGIATVSGYDSNFTSGYDADGDGDYYGPNDWLPWALGALEYWDEPTGYVGGSGETIETSDHGLSAAITPGIQSVAAFEEVSGGDWVLDAASGEYIEVPAGTGTHEKGFFHGAADLSILFSEDGTWQAWAGSFEVMDLPAGTVTVTTMYDERQGGDVQVVEIDMSLLSSSAAFPANGLLYAAGLQNDSGTDAQGLRLVNGAELHAALTVVSDGSVYVQGDYNTVDKKPAAVICDALNLLSNDWDDSKGASGLPRAGETTFNLAFISGNHETQEGAYNGGFENLPRFHEDWSGVNCNILGSFVNAWESAHATGTWAYGGNRYTAPRRNWSYDPDFNDAANLPPFTPLVVYGDDVVSWSPIRP